MSRGATDRKPRLLVLTSTYPRWLGDPEPGFVHELSKRLVDTFDVVVLGPHAAGAPHRDNLDGVQVLRYRYAPTRLETLVNDGGIITNLRRQPWKWLLVPGFLLSMAWSAWRTLRRERPDVVHAHWLLPQGLVAALLRFEPCMPPFLVTSHGADLFALKARPLQAAKRFVARRTTAITVVSAAMRDELARIGVDTKKVAVQSMGVDLTTRFTPDASIERSSDEILFVGRLVEKKGLRHLIDAMPAIVQARPSAFLTIAGFGPEEEECRKQVQRLGLQGKIHFTGAMQQAQLPALYRRAAVFVAPFAQAASGDQEGLGLVAVEAAGCGCPVVISDLPVVRQVFPEATLAFFVPPADPAALAARIVAALESPKAAAACAAAARAAVIPHFDWSIVARGYADSLLASLRAVP
jgi:glycosyltransferase involved in cell wall biosynthesis